MPHRIEPAAPPSPLSIVSRVQFAGPTRRLQFDAGLTTFAAAHARGSLWFFVVSLIVVAAPSIPRSPQAPDSPAPVAG